MLQQCLSLPRPFEDFILKTEENRGVRDVLQLQRPGWAIHECRVQRQNLQPEIAAEEPHL